MFGRLPTPLAALLLAGAAGCGSGEVVFSSSAAAGASTGTAGTGGEGAGGGTSTNTDTEGHFSFFVTSLAALQELSGSPSGFGGDLRFGETGPGAGLRGADKICATIAEKSLPGAGKKGWRAFLSATADEDGHQVDAIDRVGEGPWYDRLGRVFALNRIDLYGERPANIDPAIKDDLPNEDGVPNHAPDPMQGEVDNHDVLTGTSEDGRLFGTMATCLDWTAKDGFTAVEGRPRVGHSWPRHGGPGFPGDGSAASWMSSLDESGCAPGANLVETGPPQPDQTTVGSGGGYGGFYCFALTP